MTDPFSDADVLAATQRPLQKSAERESGSAQQTVQQHLRLAAGLGHPLAPGSAILDVGCGIGDSVAALLALGYDAQGIDVFEFWGKDFDLFWQERAPPKLNLDRLHKVDLENYQLPFPSDHFDFAFSDQVFEHVFNTAEVMSEVARVLKPGAISIHRFPGRNALIEGHINVPLTALCHNRAYLSLWARLGRRSERQHGLGWRETVDSNVEILKLCNYISKAELRRAAAQAGVKVEFVEAEEFRLRPRGFGALARVRDLIPPPLRTPAIKALALLSQRCMVISKA